MNILAIGLMILVFLYVHAFAVARRTGSMLFAWATGVPLALVFSGERWELFLLMTRYPNLSYSLSQTDKLIIGALSLVGIWWMW